MVRNENFARRERDPLRLYRYMTLDPVTMEERIRPVFVENRLYFPTRKQLNDPFECIVPEFLGAPASWYTEKAKRLTSGLGWKRTQIRKAAKELRSRESRSAVRDRLQNDIDQCGILSLSEIRDDILMWSHYAGGHKGICLEFEATRHTAFFADALKVEYSEERSRFDYRDDDFTQVQKVVFWKATHWNYEKEWRIVKPPMVGGGARSYEYPPHLLKGVIFGCWIERGLEQRVREWIELGQCAPAFYRAEVNDRMFALDIVQA